MKSNRIPRAVPLWYRVSFLIISLAVAAILVSVIWLTLSDRSEDRLEEPETEIELLPAKRTKKIGEF